MTVLGGSWPLQGKKGGGCPASDACTWAPVPPLSPALQGNPWWGECLGDPSQGPCYGWEPGAGAVGSVPRAPVLTGVNIWDLCCGLGTFGASRGWGYGVGLLQAPAGAGAVFRGDPWGLLLCESTPVHGSRRANLPHDSFIIG